MRRPSARAAGMAAALLATLAWGAQFPLGADALERLDPVWLTGIRYLIAGVLLLVILAAREGRSALAVDAATPRIAALGALGFGGFNLLVYVGMQDAGPQAASLLVASMPLVTAFVLWARTGSRPRRATWGAAVLALVGIVLVLTSGDVARLVSGGVTTSHGLVLIGVICWVTYTTAAAHYPTYSPLRYAAVSATAGALMVLMLAAALTAVGALASPTFTTLTGVAPQLAFLAVAAGALALLAWGSAVRRLGAAGAVPFINVVPLTTFALAAMRGTLPTPVQASGVVLVVAGVLAGSRTSARPTSAKQACGTPGPSLDRGRPTASSINDDVSRQQQCTACP